MMRPLMFLLKLAWDCRYRLPLLITVGFMVLDIRMQLDINVQTRRVPRPGPPTPLIGDNRGPENINNADGTDNESDASWSTFEVHSASEEE